MYFFQASPENESDNTYYYFHFTSEDMMQKEVKTLTQDHKVDKCQSKNCPSDLFLEVRDVCSGKRHHLGTEAQDIGDGPPAGIVDGKLSIKVMLAWINTISLS